MRGKTIYKPKYKYIDLARIDLDRGIIAKFGLTDNPEKDESLVELLIKADKGEIPIYEAVVHIDKIIPFCEFKPKKVTMDALKPFFLKEIKKGNMTPLCVYPQGDFFVMSDNYHAYYFYIEQGFKGVPCIIFGD